MFYLGGDSRQHRLGMEEVTQGRERCQEQVSNHRVTAMGTRSAGPPGPLGDRSWHLGAIPPPGWGSWAVWPPTHPLRAASRTFAFQESPPAFQGAGLLAETDAGLGRHVPKATVLARWGGFELQ